MEDIISNRKCKECKWFDEGYCTEPKRNRINKEKNWDYYHNFRRIPSEPACKRFKEKENDMDIKKTINDCEDALENISYTIDQLEKQIAEEPPIPEELNIPINRYGIGQTLYLPVKVVGIRSKKTPNGNNIILYEFSTASDQRMGFKIFNHVSDIRHDDKDHYFVSLPEEYIRDHFKDVDELAELFKGEKEKCYVKKIHITEDEPFGGEK